MTRPTRTDTTRPAPTGPAGPRRPRTPGGAPTPDRLAALLALVWMEVLHGRRPFGQLRPYTAPALRRRLAAQLPRATGLRGAPSITIRKVIACSPTPDVHEASVLLDRDGRTTAVAVRLEQHRGAWRAVELTAPEAGLAALATASAPRRPPRDAFDEVLEAAGWDDPPTCREAPDDTPPTADVQAAP